MISHINKKVSKKEECVMNKEEEKLIRKLENPKYKGVKSIARDLEEHLKSENKQDIIDELYRNLSFDGIKKLDKVINLYNKEHDVDGIHLKTHGQVIEEYNDAINKASALFLEYGSRYEKEDKLTDDFICAQFAEAVETVSHENMQDVIDEISKNIRNEHDRTVFQNIAKQYGEQNFIRIRVSDLTYAEAEANRLSEILHIDEEQIKSLTSDELQRKKAALINDFKFALLETEKIASPDDFQAIVNILDKSLPFDQRKGLDSAIRFNNKKNENKYETRRIKLTEKEKDASWQKFENDSLFSRKLREFKEELKELRKNRERPKDKYDCGLINGMLRSYTNLQNLISEIADFIKENIEYYTSINHQTESQQKEQPESAHDTHSYKESPFYTVMCDAYQEKGIELVNLMNTGAIDYETAKQLFVMDISYIMSQETTQQNELFSIYANSLTKAMQQSKVKTETKSSILQFISEYEQGSFDNQIHDNIENGFNWNEAFRDLKHQAARPEQQRHTSQEHVSQENPQKANPNDKRIMYAGKCTEEAHYIGESVANMNYTDPDKVMMDLVTKLGEFSHKHSELSPEQIHEYAKIAVASLLSYIPEDKDLVDNLSQFNDSNFKVDSVKSRISVLLEGAAKIDLADSVEHSYGQNTYHENVLQNDLHTSIENALLKISSQEKQQDFFSSISNYTKRERAQYFIALEAKSFGCTAEASKKIKTEKQVDKRIESLADKYIKKANTHNERLNTKQSFLVLCERTPKHIVDTQTIYDKLEQSLQDNQEAMGLLKSDVEEYNDMNRIFNFPEIDMMKGSTAEEFIEEDITEDVFEIAANLGNAKKVITQEHKKDHNSISDSMPEQASKDLSKITTEELIDSFLTGKNHVEKLNEWSKDKTDDEIQNVVTEIDNLARGDYERSSRLSEALSINGIYAYTPYTDNIMDVDINEWAR